MNTQQSKWEKLEQTQHDIDNDLVGFVRTVDNVEFNTGDPIRFNGQFLGHIVTFSIVNNYADVEVKTTRHKKGVNLDVIEHMPELPSRYQRNDVVRVRFNPHDDGNYATVTAVHFLTGSAPKYDLALWLEDGALDDPKTQERIYNVSERFLRDAQPA